MAEKERLRQPVECVIRVDDREITDLYPSLRSVTVETSRKAAAVCALTFDSVRDRQGIWNVQDSGWFVPWRRIRIEAAFGSHVEEVMRGYIRDINVDYPEDMGATVTVKCQDESLLLDREHVQMVCSTTEEPVSDGDLVQRIAQKHWSDIDVSQGQKNAGLNFSGTLIRFLLERAEANGYELLFREGKVYFGPPRLEGKPQPAITVYAGDATNCLRFSLRHDGHKPDEVRLVQAEDTGTKSISETFSPRLQVFGKNPSDSKYSGLDPFIWNLERPKGATVSERRARAQAKADESAWKLRAEGELNGALYGHVLLTNRTVTVDGVGETYGGAWYVDEVKHEFSGDGYRQTFLLLRNATGDNTAESKPDPLALVRAL